jgi:thiol-disulfide isomerase/thioredoxin
VDIYKLSGIEMKKIFPVLIALITGFGWAQSFKAPDFDPEAVWIDTGAKVPHSIKGYGGQVVLIDFWEYSCINCIRDFAVLKRWYDKYHAYGFEIVGVHFGEFQMGFSLDNVRLAAKRFQLPWPVVADLNGAVWNAYKCQAWPTRDLVDPNGDVVMQIEGEGGNQALEEKIRALLIAVHAEAAKVPADPPENAFAPQCGVTTHEAYVGNYLGSGHGALANPQGYHDGSVTDYCAEQEPADGRVMLSGRWRTDREGIISAGMQDKAVHRYHARSVYAVLSVENPKKPVRLYLQQDGKPLKQAEAGIDVRIDSQGSYVDVSQPRMYYLVQNPEFGSHLLTLEPQGKSLTLHSFTYGNDCQQRF